MILLFDAANTLIHKPTLFYKVQEVLKKFGYETTLLDLKFYHRIISEIIIFPDRTSAEFYKKFNKEWMYALGIIASDDMLDIIHSECSYLPWELFEDVNELKYLDVSKSILSNFHSGLNSIINNLMPNVFTQFIVSEVEKVRKPSLEFYERAINQIPISPSEIFTLFIDGATCINIDQNIIFLHLVKNFFNYVALPHPIAIAAGSFI